MAKHGHSKEKRSDCPLLTLALVLDGSGFVRRSEVLAGNVKEQKLRATSSVSHFRSSGPLSTVTTSQGTDWDGASSQNAYS